MPAPFTHLHTHTEYSMLDGLCRIDPLLQRAKDLGMDSLGVTDHGVLHGAIEFYTEASRVGIKPIIGIEGYLTRGSRHDRAGGDKHPHHITLLAKNDLGYRNLLKMATKAHLEGYYYKPRADHALLEEFGDGLVAFSGCLNGEIPSLIQAGQMEEARLVARWFQDRFGEDFFLELQSHENIPELLQVNQSLVDMSQELHIPLVATNDVHYVGVDDHAIHDVLLCVQTNSTVSAESRMKMSDPSYFLRSAIEMQQLFSHLPEAISNTGRIADRCDLTIDFSQLHLPRFPLPNDETAESFLRKLCDEGLRRKYPHITDELRYRLDYELDVIQKTQFPDYFLVVWDIAKFARESEILMGVRGSAAASLVLYCLDITVVDPLAYRLVFERFLNIERKEMPDIDMDFQDDRRDEVMRYVLKKYGHDNVAQIVTFGTMGAKGVLRDVGRVQGLPYSLVDEVARIIPAGYRKTDKGQIKSWNIADALDLLPEFKEKYDSDYVITELIETGKKLEGVVRNSGTHAAGVVIADEPLWNYVPLMRPTKGDEDGIAITQFSMEAIAKLGLLKMDFLGLVNLNILQKTRRFISANRLEEIDLLGIPLDDSKTFELLSSGDTAGLFQLESTGMRRYIKDLRPSGLGDLSAMIALYRPGPLEQIPNFIDSKHGRRPVSYPHPILKDILEETYGIIVYQDQVLLILQHFAGYSLGQADIVRKAMGKKIAELMAQEHAQFIGGAVAQGFPRDLAQSVWNLIEPFAGYAFNKAHSVSYALIAYWTAYFKANYTIEYMAALLTCFQGTTDKVASTIGECRRLGIEVLPPDINRSQVGFVIEGDAVPSIRFGLGAIKNVGEGAVRPILTDVQKNGHFTDVQDFCRRADVSALNRRILESLIKVGALDTLAPRGALLGAADRILSIAGERLRLRQTGQSTMFDLFGDAVEVPMPEIELGDEANDSTSKTERGVWEKELLGISLSSADPLFQLPDLGPDVTPCGQIDPEMDGEQVTVAGRVTSTRLLQTRKDNRSFIIVGLEDLQGRVEVTVWPNIYERSVALWQQDALLVINGKVRVRNDQASVACDEVHTFEEAILSERKQPAGPGPIDPNGNIAPFGIYGPNESSTTTESPELPPSGAQTNGTLDNPPVTEAREVPSVQLEPGSNPPDAQDRIALPEKASSVGKPPANTAIYHDPVASPAGPEISEPPKTLWVNLYETDDETADLARFNQLIDLVRTHPGSDVVRLTLLSAGGPSTLDLEDRCDAGNSPVVSDLMKMLGPNQVKVGTGNAGS